jgi:hypothetical protein
MTTHFSRCGASPVKLPAVPVAAGRGWKPLPRDSSCPRDSSGGRGSVRAAAVSALWWFNSVPVATGISLPRFSHQTTAPTAASATTQTVMIRLHIGTTIKRPNPHPDPLPSERKMGSILFPSPPSFGGEPSRTRRRCRVRQRQDEGALRLFTALTITFNRTLAESLLPLASRCCFIAFIQLRFCDRGLAPH